MALNLKTLGIRSLSSVVFVVVLLGSLLWNYYSFTILFFVVAMLGLNEFYKMAQKLGTQPYRTTGLLSGVIIYLAFVNFNYIAKSEAKWLSTLPFFLPFVVLAVAMLSRRENPVQNALFTIAGVVYAVLPFSLLHHLVIVRSNIFGSEYYPHILLCVIYLIWSNDTFAYLGGSLFGKNKMIERISPGKTWEGTIFGILVTFGISFLIRHFAFSDTGSLWPVLGITVPVLATIGDLVESMLKRQAGLKDSGSIMPGHGGILDRFDSLIFVSPFMYVLVSILN